MPQDAGSVSTKLYSKQSDVAEKYQAHVLLNEDRKLTKEEAVNELILLGAQASLPRDIVKEMSVEKELSDRSKRK